MAHQLKFALATSMAVVLLDGCLSVEAEEPQLCEVVPFQLPAMPPPADHINTTVTLSQTLNIPDIPVDKQVQGNLYLNSVAFQAQTGVTDLEFVSGLGLTADGDTPQCSQVQLVRYDKTSNGPVQNIHIDGPSQDLFSCVLTNGNSSNRKLAVSLSITGHIPSQASSLAMTACFRAKVTVNYSGG